MTRSTSVERGRVRARRALLAVTTILASCGTAAPALAQREDYRSLDANGVDLSRGTLELTFEEGSIGSGDAKLTLTRVRAGSAYAMASTWDRLGYLKLINGQNAEYRVALPNGYTDTFVGGPYAQSLTSNRGTGATLTQFYNAAIYQAADGTKITFSDPTDGESATFCQYSNLAAGQSCPLQLASIVEPDGKALSFTWDVEETGNNPSGTPYHRNRLTAVSNAFGYSIRFDYSGSDWYRRTAARFFNTAVSTSTPQASVSYGYPAPNTYDITDFAGQVWRVTASSIKRPGESAAGFSANDPYAVTSVTRDGVPTSYARTVNGAAVTMTVTNALNQSRTIESNAALGRPTKVTDELGKITQYTYDTFGRLTKMINPEGDFVEYTLDARGNRTQVVNGAKPGSGMASLVATASFDATCANAVTCNEPNSTTDARGNTTNYTYDPTHGGVTKAERPASTPGAPRPTTTYSYTMLAGEYRLTGTSICTTSSSCPGLADEIRSSATYDASGNLTGTTTGAGDGSVTASTTYAYDAMGNVVGVDGPLPSAFDTTSYRYDAARRPIAVIGPDPDGGGSRKRRAQRIAYDIAGRATSIAIGSATSVGALAGSNFTVADEVVSTYVGDRKTSDKGVGRGVVQYDYDAAGRPKCTVQRMNLAPLSSQPVDPCQLDLAGVGYGPDRLSVTYHDATGRVYAQQSALFTAAQSTDTDATFTDNGKLRTVTDANGNRTTYTYDGLDRLQRIYYPVATVGANASSTTDYDELGYDANGNVTSRRLRDGYTLGYAYDALDRLTTMTTAHLTTDDQDVAYSYDLAGRLTKAAKNAANQTSLAYDALGRRTGESNYYYALASRYDAAGRRTRLTWNDGFFVTYDYDAAGAMTAIRENGAGLLATFGYDDAGRRTSLTRGDGSVTSYGYDGTSRLASQGLDLQGAASDLALTFGYNPASQITSTTRSNDAYAYTTHANASVAETRDGMNRLTSQGSTPVSYDSRGNVVAVGSQGYVYSTTNRLAIAPQAGVFLYADSLERMDYISSEDVQLAHDGEVVASEHVPTGGAGPVARRYVYGPGADEPVAMYEGSAIDDGTRRYLHADERGSIVAVTGTYGNLVGINRYDEYGVPGSGNVGRFGYTGQAWLPSLGMYHYKARMYAPRLGRFMQADPIGYTAGMNLYGYVGGDPVNFNDPSGLYCFGAVNTTNADLTESKCKAAGGTYIPDIDVTVERYKGFIFGGNINDTGISVGNLISGAGAPGTVVPPSANKQCSVRQPDGSTPSSNARLVRGGVNAAGAIARVSPWAGVMAYGAIAGGWLGAVLPHSIWDYKRRGGTDTMGNVNYGATGNALGIPLNVLLRVAGLVQGPNERNEGQPYDLSPNSSYGDQPRDQQAIKDGAGC